MMGVETTRELINELLCCLLSPLLVIVDQWQQALGQHGQIPMHDARLIRPGVAALSIDGAKAGIRIEMIHERAGAIVDGLAA